MQMIRYLNGRELAGPMPSLLLAEESVRIQPEEVPGREKLPLPASGSSVILKTEEYGSGKEHS